MAIKYKLQLNKMDPADLFYAARVLSNGTLGLNELADEIVNMGTTVTKTDVLAVLETACQAIENNLLKGFRVSVGGVVDISTSIRGKFDGPGDAFDPARNTVEVCASAGSRVRNTVSDKATVEKQAAPLRLPILEEFIDNETGDVNIQATPGGIGTVIGNLLQYDEAESDEGIYFVSSGGTPTKVTAVETNKPGKLTFLVPSLSADTYDLELRARLNKTGGVKTGALPVTLDVVIPPVASSKGNGGKKRIASASTTTNNSKRRRTSGPSASTTGGKKKRRVLAKA